MALLYDLSIGVMSLAIKIAGALRPGKARLLSEGRSRAIEQIEQQMSRYTAASERPIWVHCASLGEFEQGRPLIEELRARRPTTQPIVVTFFSPSGYEVRKNYPVADHVFYLPADTPANARRLVRALKPEMAIFVKYEYWYNYLSELKRSGVPAYVVSAIFRPDMVFFRPWGGFMRRTLRLLSHLFVQDDTSRDLLHGIGLDNVTVSGDTRFDRVKTITSAAPQVEITQTFANDHQTLVAGSTWPADEEHLLTLACTNPELRLIIAPHEIGEDRILALVQRAEQAGYRAVRYTAITDPHAPVDADLLIIDTIGILSGIYQYGQIAYIGGGFGRGIHNTLEAATWGVPLIFGPRYGSFAEAVDMVAQGVAHPISTAAELQGVVSQLTTEPQLCREQGAAAAQYVLSRTGATRAILAQIAPNHVAQ